MNVYEVTVNGETWYTESHKPWTAIYKIFRYHFGKVQSGTIQFKLYRKNTTMDEFRQEMAVNGDKNAS